MVRMTVQFRVRHLLALITVAAVVCGVMFRLRVEAIAVFVGIWTVQAMIMVITTGPIVFLTRKRVNWLWGEALVLVLPSALWLMLATTDFVSKSMSNICEPIYVSFATPVVAGLRALAPKWLPNKFCAISFVTILCLAAVIAYFAVPALPE
jgi:hypothetical protein